MHIEERREIAMQRIFSLMNSIEDRVGKMYHEIDAIYFYYIMNTKNLKYSYVINKLSKQLDKLSEV